MENPAKPEVEVAVEEKPEMSEVYIGPDGVALTEKEKEDLQRKNRDEEGWREQK